MAGSALDRVGRWYRWLGLLFSISASLFWWLSADTDLLLGLWRIYDKHGRKLPLSDAGTYVADILTDACYEDACLYYCDVGVLCCGT